MAFHNKTHKLIGHGKGFLPWQCRIDMNFFKYKTNGNYQLMGHNTFNSSKSFLKNDKIHIVNSYQDILDKFKMISSSNLPKRDIYISGGKKIYELMMKNNTYIDTIYQNEIIPKKYKI